MVLQLRYWGAEWSGTQLGILVDGVTVAEQSMRTIHPGEWCTSSYPLPPETTRGKRTVRVTVRHLEGGDGGRVFHLRLIRENVSGRRI